MTSTPSHVLLSMLQRVTQCMSANTRADGSDPNSGHVQEIIVSGHQGEFPHLRNLRLPKAHSDDSIA